MSVTASSRSSAVSLWGWGFAGAPVATFNGFSGSIRSNSHIHHLASKVLHGWRILRLSVAPAGMSARMCRHQAEHIPEM